MSGRTDKKRERSRLEPGLRLGRLTLVERTNERRNGAVVWLCSCSCGSTTRVVAGSLQAGRSRSCGCGQARVTHGGSRSREYKMLTTSKRRAKVTGREFNLELTDIVVPKLCPVLGIPLSWSSRITDNTPSVDRVDNSKGYTKDNIRIISMRANRIKSQASAEELRLVLEYMENS